MTRDIDMVVDVQPHQLQRLVQAFRGDYYLDAEAARRAVVERRLVNAVHEETLAKVDLVIRKDEPFRRAEFDRRATVSVHGRDVRIVSREDLLLSKLIWGAESGPGSTGASFMNDTLPATDAYLVARYRELTPGQRIEMACGMWTAAVTMIRAGFDEAADRLSPSEQRVLLVQRLYGGDMSASVMSALVERIRNTPREDTPSANGTPAHE